MRYLGLLIVGVVFGIALTKGEIISWFRIQEMFRFQSFHMYGVIGSAVVMGALIVAAFRQGWLKPLFGEHVQLVEYPKSFWRYLLGGTLFGFGWAMTGACPGPLYILLGNGFSIILVVIASALLGTVAYGALRSKLPH